jgi:white-opaque regulator 2
MVEQSNSQARMQTQHPQQPQQSQQAQQTTGYPSPHSYPSPSLPPSYTYPPSQPGQTKAESYNNANSPSNTNMSLPPLNLPPIRSMDGQVPSPAHPPPSNASLPPVPSMNSYYPPPGQGLPMPGQQMHSAGSAPSQIPRPGQYQTPLESADQRMMSGGRHKKEIKRRTKTGCLTCRKRRIKVRILLNSPTPIFGGHTDRPSMFTCRPRCGRDAMS